MAGKLARSLCLFLLAGGLTAGVAFASSRAEKPNPKDQALARRMTLHLRDMPLGWRAEKLDKSANTKCGSVPTRGFSVTGQADSSFSSGQTSLAVSTVGVFKTTVGSRRAYRLVHDALPKCLPALIKAQGGNDPTTGAMSFPPVGDQSSAWQSQATVKSSGLSLTIYLDTILVRKARAFALYIFGGITRPSPAREIVLVRKAVARG
jgi:hypothetical protein